MKVCQSIKYYQLSLWLYKEILGLLGFLHLIVFTLRRRVTQLLHFHTDRISCEQELALWGVHLHKALLIKAKLFDQNTDILMKANLDVVRNVDSTLTNHLCYFSLI